MWPAVFTLPPSLPAKPMSFGCRVACTRLRSPAAQLLRDLVTPCTWEYYKGLRTKLSSTSTLLRNSPSIVSHSSS